MLTAGMLSANEDTELVMNYTMNILLCDELL